MQRTMPVLAPLALALVAAALPAAAGATQPPAGTPSAVVRLSDEHGLTRYANPFTRGAVRARPQRSARVVAHLRLLTEDGYPEVLPALAQQTDAHGATWVHVRLPGRPNGRTGWVPRSSLSDLHTVHTRLVVDRRRLRVTLYDRGRRVFSAPVGVGKASTPTPAGRFWVREKFRVRGAPTYGPRAIGTSAYAPTLSDWPGGGVVGLHGTDEPSLIPGRPSHGCIRLRNADISRLYRLVPVGTPVRIL